MNVYIVYEPDYECANKLCSFRTKDLAIEFIRSYYPNYRISEIDKPYITYNDTLKDDTLEVENDFKYDCFIKEEKILDSLPDRYCTISLSFDNYTNEWVEYVDITSEQTKYINNDLFYSKSLLMYKGFNKDKEMKKYKNYILTADMLKYKCVLVLENGDEVIYGSIFSDDTIYIKGNGSNLTMKYDEDEEYLVNEDNEIINIKEEIIKSI